MIYISVTYALIFVIVICLIFALSNGLHDASSVVATFINSGGASPKQAVLLASVFGFLGAIFGGNAVADTISNVIDLPANKSLLLILFSAIFGAVIWNLITWKFGIPSSSTHALIGGIIGAVIVSSGYERVLWGFSDLITLRYEVKGVAKVIFALVISPLIGFALAFILEKISSILLRNAKVSLNKWLKKIQWVIAACLGFAHGANDSQKIIGIITLTLFAGESIKFYSDPVWVRICVGIVMFIGTLFGGWSIMKTIGRGIYDIKPIHSVNSQLASAGSLLISNITGAPVSTTHVVVGSVMGVGAADQYKMVRWQTVKAVLIAWFITMPLSGLVSAFIFILFNFIFKVI